MQTQIGTVAKLGRAITLGGVLVLAVGLAAPGAAQAAWLGVAMSPRGSKVRVDRVLDTSPAQKAGIRSGDIITSVDGNAVTSPGQVIAASRRTAAGSSLLVGIQRNGRQLTLAVTMAKAPGIKKLLPLYLRGMRAPNFSVPIIHGGNGRVSLSSLRGNIVLLYFWATWCESCKILTPKLVKLNQRFAKRGVKIFSVARGKSSALMAKISRGLSVDFPVGWQPKNRIGRLYKSVNVPTLVMIDRRGVIRDAVLGSSYTYGWLQGRVRQLLASR